MDFWQRISQLDRRWIYLAVALAVIFPLLVPMKMKLGITPEARQLYETIEALPDSSVVMLTFDYYPSTVAETRPMSIGALHQMFRKNLKVITMTTIPLGGPSIADRTMREMAELYHKIYGVDYVNLGYKANYTAVLLGMGSSIESIYPSDQYGTPLAKLPLMQTVKNYDQISFIFIVADNGIVDNWISIVNAQFSKPMGAGVTAVMAPKFYSYVQAKQMTGLLGGMKGAAEYEMLVNKPAMALIGMDSQSLAHLLIIGFVIAGNVAFFVTRKKKESKG
ncbi:MAG: hypothetical protein NT028_01545 [candidate division Zixibacteria bacterium]|nr:hypothetical protein [candidate division Zixibacteria bacterium]